MEEIIILKKRTYDDLNEYSERIKSALLNTTGRLEIACEALFNAMLLTYKFEMYDLEKLLDFESGASALSDVEVLKKVGFTEEELKQKVKEAYEKRT